MTYDYSVVETAGLTQGEFAKMVQMSRVTVNRWIKTSAGPTRTNDQQTVLRALKMLTVAVKLGILPDALPPRTRGVSSHRQEAIDGALEQVKQRVAEIRAQRGA